jgi:hypothetical protein
MNATTGWTQLWLVLVGLGMTFAPSVRAQVQTEKSTSTGQATQHVEVQRAEVVYVSGNDLVVKMDDGTIRHIANVPESARATVDGKEVGIHDLKPGMKLEKTITTTTTPKLITTVQSVTGKVWHVSAPTSVTLTLDDGTNQTFKIPKGQKFNIDGNMVDAWGLKKGMKVTATKVVEEPVTEMAVQQEIKGTMPPPPPADMPILVVVAQRPAAPKTETAANAPPAAPTELPQTASELPLLGLLGVFAGGSSLALRLHRRSS